MKFDKELLIELMDCSPGDEVDGLRLVEESGWSSQGKYDYAFWIFEFGGKHYKIVDSRTGSYYSDYYFSSSDWPFAVECTEVEKVEVVKYEWRAKQ